MSAHPNVWKAGFSRFLNADAQRLHFAAHSHHYWPDVTFEAHQQAWLDAASWVDDKWEHIFGNVYAEAQHHVAKELELSSPQSVVFAPNTHELVMRLLSCLPERPVVVSSDSEFHSFERQTRRLEEEGLARVIRVPAAPVESFPQRVLEVSAQADLVFLSHVFFNSGAVVESLDALVNALPSRTLVAIDGYHGFGAVPTPWSAAGTRAFYLAGGYKYAMSGEGVCFMHMPAAAASLRPRNTGWFAAFDALQDTVSNRVPYAPGARRFLGATFDPSGLYRFNAAQRWRERVGLSTRANQAHAHQLQRQFVEGVLKERINLGQLVVSVDNPARGQFLTFETPEAAAISATLKMHRVVTDARGTRLRFGFGPYQDEGDVVELLKRLKRAVL